MTISEAVLMAIKEGKVIYRESQPGIRILPTNTYDCCILIAEQSDIYGSRWNPNANDLIANDWKVN